MKLKREYFIPTESSTISNIQKITREGINAEVYIYDSIGRPAAACFGGRRSKPDKRFYYNSVESRDQAVEDHFTKCKEQDNWTKTRRTDGAKAERGLNVGDYIYDSWGYDQTNINFYKVVGLKGKKMVLIVPVVNQLASSNPPCDKVIPSDTVAEYDTLLSQSHGEVEPVPKLAKNGSVRLCDGHHATKWDGDPLYQTSSGWGH